MLNEYFPSSPFCRRFGLPHTGTKTSEILWKMALTQINGTHLQVLDLIHLKKKSNLQMKLKSRLQFMRYLGRAGKWQIGDRRFLTFGKKNGHLNVNKNINCQYQNQITKPNVKSQFHVWTILVNCQFKTRVRQKVI